MLLLCFFQAFYSAFLRYSNLSCGSGDLTLGRTDFCLLITLLADEGVAFAAEQRAVDVAVGNRAGCYLFFSASLKYRRSPELQGPDSSSTFHDDRVPVFLANASTAARVKFLVRRLSQRYTELTMRELAFKAGDRRRALHRDDDAPFLEEQLDSVLGRAFHSYSSLGVPMRNAHHTISVASGSPTQQQLSPRATSSRSTELPPTSPMSRPSSGSARGAYDLNAALPEEATDATGMCFDQWHLMCREVKVRVLVHNCQGHMRHLLRGILISLFALQILGKLATIDIFRVFHDACRGLLSSSRPAAAQQLAAGDGGASFRRPSSIQLRPLVDNLPTAAAAAAAEEAALSWLLGGGDRPRKLLMTLDQFRAGFRAVLRTAFDSGQRLFGAPEPDAYNAPLALDSGVTPATIALRLAVYRLTATFMVYCPPARTGPPWLRQHYTVRMPHIGISVQDAEQALRAPGAARDAQTGAAASAAAPTADATVSDSSHDPESHAMLPVAGPPPDAEASDAAKRAAAAMEELELKYQQMRHAAAAPPQSKKKRWRGPRSQHPPQAAASSTLRIAVGSPRDDNGGVAALAGLAVTVPGSAAPKAHGPRGQLPVAAMGDVRADAGLRPLLSVDVGLLGLPRMRERCTRKLADMARDIAQNVEILTGGPLLLPRRDEAHNGPLPAQATPQPLRPEPPTARGQALPSTRALDPAARGGRLVQVQQHEAFALRQQQQGLPARAPPALPRFNSSSDNLLAVERAASSAVPPDPSVPLPQGGGGQTGDKGVAVDPPLRLWSGSIVHAALDYSSAAQERTRAAAAAAAADAALAAAHATAQRRRSSANVSAVATAAAIMAAIAGDVGNVSEAPPGQADAAPGPPRFIRRYISVDQQQQQQQQPPVGGGTRLASPLRSPGARKQQQQPKLRVPQDPASPTRISLAAGALSPKARAVVPTTPKERRGSSAFARSAPTTPQMRGAASKRGNAQPGVFSFGGAPTPKLGAAHLASGIHRAASVDEPEAVTEVNDAADLGI
jgi:hypothetical protein